MKLMEHQETGKAFLRNGGTLLAYDMGLGKTLTSLAAAEEERGDQTVVVGCPAIATGVWEAEITKWFPGRKVLLLTSDTVDRLGEGWDYIITSLDLVARNTDVEKALRATPFTGLIIDEAHALKAETSLRSRIWLMHRDSIRAQAGFIWLLTGTPTPNHAGELYPLIKGTIGIDMKGYEFEERYCRHKMVTRNGREVRVVAGTNLIRVNELRARLKGWWLRLKTSDVFKDMPPLYTRVVPIDSKLLTPELHSFETSKEGLLLRDALRAGDFRAFSLDDDDSMSRYRKLLAQAKAAYAVDYVDYLLDSGSRGVLLWFWHQEAMDMAAEEMAKRNIAHVRIDGSTPKSKRDAAVKSFQSPSGPKVFLGQIKAAGVSITLTKAVNSVFAEASWNPAENLQAMKRAHRIGQDHPVQSDFLAVRDSLDMTLLSVLERKQAQSDALQGE